VVEFKDKYCYQIPSFSVISVLLRHAVVQMYNLQGELDLFDIFFKEDKALWVQSVPVYLEPLQTCFVDVSKSIDGIFLI
jgi:hypothetical protein